jgi:hypothetical protein
LTHCPQIYIRKEISRPGFLDVRRYSFRNSIDITGILRKKREIEAVSMGVGTLRYVNLGTVCHARGCMVGCMGRISHTNLKIRIVISGIATSKKSHSTRVLLVSGQI